MNQQVQRKVAIKSNLRDYNHIYDRSIYQQHLTRRDKFLLTVLLATAIIMSYMLFPDVVM